MESDLSETMSEKAYSEKSKQFETALNDGSSKPSLTVRIRRKPAAKSIRTDTTVAEPVVESKFLTLSQDSGEDPVKLKQLTNMNGRSKMFQIEIENPDAPLDTSNEIPLDFTLVQQQPYPYEDASTMDALCQEDLESQRADAPK